MALYIEQGRAFKQPIVRRYDDLPAAAMDISRVSHCSAAMVLTDLRARRTFHACGEWWAVVTARKMRERADRALTASKQMESGEEVDA